MTATPITPGGEVILYETPDGQARVDVRVEKENVWLSLNQMAELFDRDKSVISRHLRSVFASGELARDSVVAKNATTAGDGKIYQVEYFNLDAIISVGYRVNSKRGTQFRIWATRTLKEHLIRGYTLHEKRLREKGFGEIEQAVGLLARTLTQHALVTDEGRAVLDVVQQYTRAWRLLLEYDENRLAERPRQPLEPAADLSLDAAREAIAGLRAALAVRGEATDLFEWERSEQLSGILAAIEQTFGGEPLGAGTRCASALLRHQGSSIFRWQQAHRHAVVPRLSAAQSVFDACGRHAAPRGQRDGCAGAADCRKRSGAQGFDDPAHS